jgi:hypothetical protein
MCDGDDARRGRGERGDSDAGKAAKSLGRATAGAPSHGPARLPGHHRIELPGHGRVGLRGSWGAMTVSPSGIHGRLDTVLAVFTDQIQPPTKLQKEEKLANLITYAFTINQVLHVFGEYYFVGHKHKYMKDFTERRFPMLICAKE